MKKNYDDEATQYQSPADETTQYEERSSIELNATNTSYDETMAKQAKNVWKRTAAGAGSGLLIGGVATVLMGMAKADSNLGDDSESDNHKEVLSNPEWVDDRIQVATSVTDDMSFGEAFGAARTEVGPGGCFEWHGNVYATYTADEWNHMTAEERAEFSDHFSWNHIDHSSSSVAQHSTDHNAHTSTSATTHDHAAPANDDDIDVVSVNHTDNHQATTQTDFHQQANQADVIEVSQAEPEIEILGVVHDNETGANIGGMSVGGQEVIFIDVDGNMEFDYMATDLNGNGQVDPGEVVDIQGQGMTVDDFNGIANPTDDMLTSNDTHDYSSDAFYEG